MNLEEILKEHNYYIRETMIAKLLLNSFDDITVHVTCNPLYITLRFKDDEHNYVPGYDELKELGFCMNHDYSIHDDYLPNLGFVPVQEYVFFLTDKI